MYPGFEPDYDPSLWPIEVDDAQNISLVVKNVRLPHKDPELAKRYWSVECHDGRIDKVQPMAEASSTMKAERRQELDAHGSLMLPSSESSFRLY